MTDLHRVFNGAAAALAVMTLTCSSLAQGDRPRDFDTLKQRAETFYEEGSFKRALNLYQQAESMELSEPDERWVAYRIGDAMWRNQAATNTNDSTIYERARQRLQAVLEEYETTTERDDLWVYTQRSLGDYWWDRRSSRNWSQGWNHYNQVLDYWAGNRNLDQARSEYLDLIFHAVEPGWLTQYPYYRQYVHVPPAILENAVNIADRDEDLTRAQYLLAMAMRQQGGGWREQQRVEELFSAVIDQGRNLKWYDDALFYYAEWLSQQGRPVRQENGSWTNKQDYRTAVDLYRRLVSEYRKGQTTHFDNASNRIQQITSPALGMSVSNIFLPGSEVQFHLNWRNVKGIELALHKVNLPRDVKYPRRDPQNGTWLDHIALDQAQRVRHWTKETDDTGDYIPGNESIVLDKTLDPGAYLLIATAGGHTRRDLVLVSDATIVMKTVADQALIYYCDAIDGSPIPGATVAVSEVQSHGNNRWTLHSHNKKTDDDGLAVFDLGTTIHSSQLFVAAAKEDRQAFNASYANGKVRPGQEYRIYAFTDRPAYRPGDIVNWRMTTRLYRGSTYSTPADETLEYQINDSRGSKVKEGQLKLNEFGSAWGDLDVTDTMPLGEFTVQFWDKGRSNHIGNATLFRLEEYKLPEYEVTVSTGTNEEGKPKTYQVGDRVEIEIDAQYYFGAPVANADVEVIVYQRPFWHWWQPPHAYQWLYEDSNPYRWQQYGGQGQQMKREQIKTDQAGKAILSFDTPLNTNQDFEYNVEVRVVDSSRREVVGGDSVKVTRNKYFVYPEPEHKIYLPGDTGRITFRALDANSNPVTAMGEVKVYRDTWTEIWISPDGEEITGRPLASEKARHRYFPPPPPDPNMLGWRLKYRGYKSELVHEQQVATDDEGIGELNVKLATEGYYRITWLSEKMDLYPISAQTQVWACSNASDVIGYHHAGVDVIVDKDTFRAGEATPVMLSVPTGNRYVLFTVEGNDLHDYRVVHVEGTVKLMHIDIEDRHEPNVWLNAVMVQSGQVHMDSEQVVVPPLQHFMEVDVAMNQDAYQPGETGSMTVTTRDADGNPVSAEVAISMVDESIFYIQQELAGDPRQFFFDRRQAQQVVMSGTFYQKAYVNWKKNEKDQLIQIALNRRDGIDVDELQALKEENGRFDDRLRRSETRARASGNMLMSQSSLELAADASMPMGGGRGGGFAGGGGGIGGGRFNSNGPAGLPSDGWAADAKQGQNRLAEPDAPVRVRSDFRSTAVWVPSITTDDSGTATIDVPFPDNTTRWKATARANTTGAAFGIGSGEAKTRQPLIVRLQAPRFFLVGDETTVSAVINNNTDESLSTKYSIEIEGLDIVRAQIDGRAVDPSTTRIDIPANSSASVDWLVRVTSAGTARITASAQAGRHSDGMEKTYTVYEHGIEKHIIESGKVRGNELTIQLDLPAQRRAGSTTLSVQVTPSMAVTMLDALPYLIDYPYGCTEQTMSRFLPCAIVAKTLEQLDVDPEMAMSRLFGGIEQEHADDTHPKGRKNLDQLADMMSKALARLGSFQNSDGGWGWWKNSTSDHYMTSYVVWGLSVATEAGVEIDANMLARGVDYLRKELVEEESNYDNQAWMLHGLAAYQHALDDNARSEFEITAADNIWSNRNKLNAYTRSLFALAMHYYGENERAQVLIRNLENGVKIDETPDTSVVVRGTQNSGPGVIATAHWGADGVWHRWSQGPIESTAFALRALLAIDPDHELIEPVTNWLIKNRRGAQWSNTRDTAIAVLALNDYLITSGELTAELDYELLVNGRSVARRKVTAEDLFSGPSTFEIDDEYIRDGVNDIRIVRRGGTGSIYYLADAGFFSLEEPIEAAGHELFARRDYYKLVPYKTLLKGYEYDRVPMKDGDSVQSGERIEVVLTVESKNDYEYLVFEDLKPAGFEAVQVQSGEPIYARQLKQAGIERRFDGGPLDAQDIGRDPGDYTDRTQSAYQELRDRHVALFFDRLGEGVWEVQYELRAEVPGEFHALPVMGHAMYVPEIRCNSREIRMTVYDRD